MEAFYAGSARRAMSSVSRARADAERRQARDDVAAGRRGLDRLVDGQDAAVAANVEPPARGPEPESPDDPACPGRGLRRIAEDGIPGCNGLFSSEPTWLVAATARTTTTASTRALVAPR